MRDLTNGKSLAFEARDQGSSPCPAAKLTESVRMDEDVAR